MDPNDRRRMDDARDAATRAYAPYSGFRVGALAVAADGAEYLGANVENAAFPSSICAEANAITTAVANGARRIEAVYVTCLDDPGCTPCGNCRQIMREFGVERVILDGPGGEVQVLGLDELLPRSFGPNSLGSPRTSS